MKKEERHQIKRDDLATLLDRAMLYAGGNVRTVGLSAAGLVVVVMAAFGVRAWMAGRDQEASLLVGQMIQTFHAPVTASLQDLQENPAGAATFTSLQERDTKVLELADRILSHNPSAGSAPKALYYKGLALANLKRYDEAAGAMDLLLRTYSRDFLAPMVRYELARVHEAQGKPGEALVQYQAIAEDSASLFPKEEGLLGIARCQEAMGQRAEALKTYQRILKDFPESEYLSEARNKVAELS